MQQSAFAERFLKHLDKIDPAEIESFISRTVKERDFTARIFEALTEGVVVFDAECRVSMLNSAACRILRLPRRKRYSGERLLDVIEPGALRNLIETFLSDPRPYMDQEIVLHAGSQKIYNVHLMPIAEPKNDETRWGNAAEAESTSAAALVLQDLTPSLTRQQREAQERKIASLATLTAGVAHDIKNPLNSLSIHAQLLQRAIDDMPQPRRRKQTKAQERIAQSCAVIGEEVERLRKCVDDFIGAARPQKPSLLLSDLNSIVRAVAEMARLEFEARQVRIETRLEPDLPAIQLDEKQLQHALRNLLRNSLEAIEAARRAAMEGCVTLRTMLVDETVSLEVADNGSGIAKADMPKLFEPYFTTKFNGSGLGLMAVGRIVREHGGEISVRSVEDEGTTFTLEFPALSRRVKLLESR